MRAKRLADSVVLLVIASALAGAPAAQAAFPGSNAKIAFTQSGQIKVVNPDGTGEVGLRSGGLPAWSPDGAQLAFNRDGDLYTMPADGSSETLIPGGQRPSWAPDGSKIAGATLWCFAECYHLLEAVDVGSGTRSEVVCGGEDPAWSPDGTRIAFLRGLTESCDNDLVDDGIYTISPNGTGLASLLIPDSSARETVQDPEWSPDASRVAFASNLDGSCGPKTRFVCNEIYAMPAGGGPATRLTTNTTEDVQPVWSPDGTQIAFSSNRDGDYEIWRMSTDGSNPVKVTDNSVDDFAPSWQPIPVNAYPRPKGASPMRASLVVAFPECTTPNSVHGPPLEHPSCGDIYNPPVGNSQHVTVGTPETNGAAAQFIGVLRIAAHVGNPATPADEADVGLRVSATDIRCLAAGAPATCGAPNVVGADYTGELQARVELRITDKDNTPSPSGPGAATVVDMPYEFTVPCTETAENVGSSCEIDTTADALVPGTIKEGARTIWQLGQVEVLDGGPDGDVGTSADSQVFLRQGIFVP